MGAMMERDRVTMMVQFVCHPQEVERNADKIKQALMDQVVFGDVTDAVSVITRQENVR